MLGLPDGARACLFDLDGVLTDTASVHAAAWKQMFDDYLRARAERDGTPFRAVRRQGRLRPLRRRPPPARRHPRRSSRRAASSSPRARPDDPPGTETLWGLSTRKNDLVQEKIRTVGVDVYPGSVRYLQAVKDAGLLTACVSSSANAEQVLEVAGLSDFIDHRVDGVVAKQRGLPGKPAPDTFLAAAADLGVPKEQAVVFEDALAGVAVGPRGRLRLRGRRRPRRARRRAAGARRRRRRAGLGLLAPDAGPVPGRRTS